MVELRKLGKWMLLDEIGGGGQGTVHEAIDFEKFIDTKNQVPRIAVLIGNARGSWNLPLGKADIAKVTDLVRSITEFDECFGALKYLNPEARPKAQERMKREIEALSAISNPHLAEILDHNADEGWFVTRYYRRKALTVHMAKYEGDAPGALKAVRGVVDALASMHGEGLIHRDVKPDNIFVGDDGRLILGDLGLVFPVDAEGRLSSTEESAGTSAWMAPWARGKRLDETNAKLDVFGIAKVLYCMVAGCAELPFWFDDDSPCDLESLFAGNRGLSRLKQLLEECVVRVESKCKYADAAQLLLEIDSAIEDTALERPEMPDTMGWTCRVCGRGEYKVLDYSKGARNTGNSKLSEFGLRPESPWMHKVGICSHCGHVEHFAWYGNNTPPAWGERPKI